MDDDDGVDYEQPTKTTTTMMMMTMMVVVVVRNRATHQPSNPEGVEYEQ
jgi:hypothetical protein